MANDRFKLSLKDTYQSESYIDATCDQYGAQFVAPFYAPDTSPLYLPDTIAASEGQAYSAQPGQSSNVGPGTVAFRGFYDIEEEGILVSPGRFAETLTQTEITAGAGVITLATVLNKGDFGNLLIAVTPGGMSPGDIVYIKVYNALTLTTEIQIAQSNNFFTDTLCAIRISETLSPEMGVVISDVVPKNVKIECVYLTSGDITLDTVLFWSK